MEYIIVTELARGLIRAGRVSVGAPVEIDICPVAVTA